MVSSAATLEPKLQGLDVVRLCYEYAYLKGREALGLRLGSAELARLRLLQDTLESPGEGRQHRRLPVAIPVLLRTAAGLRRGMLLNVSGGGMFVATDEVVAPGESVQVRVGSGNEYSFPCVVQWIASGARVPGLGLRLAGMPVEVRRRGLAVVS